MATILVTDGQQRKTLAAARSLGRAGHRVLVAEQMWATTTFFSRYAARRAVYPSPATRPAAYRRWLDQHIAAAGVDVHLPMDDATVEAALVPPPACATLLPPPTAFAVFRDKLATLRAAEAASVAVPPWTVAAGGSAVVLRAAATLGYPVVLKPRVGSGGRGLVLAASPAELAAALEGTRNGADLLLQAWVGWGPQYDVCLLYDRHGRRTAAFVQRELRHYPLAGGPSTVQESVVAPDLVDVADRLLSSVGWVGLAEVEFRVDAAGVPRLMEVNPRCWASLQLAIAAGVDFPLLQVRLALGETVEAVAGYRVGLRGRCLLPGDILHYLANPKRAEMDPPFWPWQDPGLRDDILDWSDPLPAVGFALAAAVYAVRPQLRRMVLH